MFLKFHQLYPLILIRIQISLAAYFLEVLKVPFDEVKKVAIGRMEWVYHKPFYLLLV